MSGSTKKWYQSLTIWGTMIIMACGLILPVIGQANYAAFLAEEQAGIVEWLGAVGTLVGGVMAFIGRLWAVDEIE